MSDTQWSRYQVFVQESEGKPHQDYGSVHAPDAELALLNARDVFARRPDCVSMWVVPVEAIYTITAEKLKGKNAAQSPGKDCTQEPYYLFIKWRQTGTMTFAGDISACSPEEALEKALQESIDRLSALVWWVFPRRWVVKSDHGAMDSDFSPAREKTFRMATDFHTVSDLRKIKHTAGENPE